MSSTPSSSAAYAAVLQRPSQAPRVICLLTGYVLIAWLGWLGLTAWEAYCDVRRSHDCAESGGAWAHGACEAPQIELHMAPVERERSPLLGPGGA